MSTLHLANGSTITLVEGGEPLQGEDLSPLYIPAEFAELIYDSERINGKIVVLCDRRAEWAAKKKPKKKRGY